MSAFDPPGVLGASWQARALYWMIQPALDEQGRIECGSEDNITKHVAAIVGWPVEIAENALVELRGNGVLIPFSTGISDRHFLSRNGHLTGAVENEENKKKNKNKNNSNISTGQEPRRRGRPPGDPRHRSVVDAWHTLHIEHRREAPIIAKKDGMAVKRLLDALPDVTVEEIVQRMKVAFADGWFKVNGNLALFCSRWSNYKPGLSLGGVSPQTTASMRPLGAPPESM